MQERQSRMNEIAWSYRACEHWVRYSGPPDQAAAQMKNDPASFLRQDLQYLGDVEGKRVINLLGSNGRRAVPLALLGADVTVVDISPEGARYALELAEEVGGAIVRAWSPGTQAPLLAGVSHDLVLYRDSGGLWRMGHEFRGGTFAEVTRASARRAQLEAREREGGLEVSCVSELGGQAIRRLYWFASDSPLIRLRVEGCAPEGHTVTAAFATGLAASRLAMDLPGGVVVRPRLKLYDPTFWALQQFVHLQDDAKGRGVALCQRLPGAVACRANGTLEAVALRNAIHERAWRVLPIPACPATGHERESYAFECALHFTEAGDWQANALPALAAGLAGSPWDTSGRAALRELARSLATVDRADVAVTALKPASRGEGLIARLYTPSAAGQPVALALPGRTVRAAFLCDARERDLEPLEVVGGSVRLTMPGNIATVRLLEA